MARIEQKFWRLERLLPIAAAAVCLPLAVWVLGWQPSAPIRLLISAGAASALMSIVRTRRRQLREAPGSRQAGQQLLDHDIASALLAIEGGANSLRLSCKDRLLPGASSNGVQAFNSHVESMAHAIETEIGRIRRLVCSDVAQPGTCEVSAVVVPLVNLLRAKGAEVQIDLRGSETVLIASDDLARVMSTLLDNCHTHAAGTPVTISGSMNGANYELTVKDSGPGVAPAIIDRAFEFGVSSLANRGLGLYSVESIVEASGGSVSISSAHDGTTVRMHLPAAEASLPASHQPSDYP